MLDVLPFFVLVLLLVLVLSSSVLGGNLS